MSDILMFILSSCLLIGLCLGGLWLVMRGGDADEAIERLRELRGEPNSKRKADDRETLKAIEEWREGR